jgi:hypothetical protein
MPLPVSQDRHTMDSALLGQVSHFLAEELNKLIILAKDNVAYDPKHLQTINALGSLPVGLRGGTGDGHSIISH